MVPWETLISSRHIITVRKSVPLLQTEPWRRLSHWKLELRIHLTSQPHTRGLPVITSRPLLRLVSTYGLNSLSTQTIWKSNYEILNIPNRYDILLDERSTSVSGLSINPRLFPRDLMLLSERIIFSIGIIKICPNAMSSIFSSLFEPRLICLKLEKLLRKTLFSL